MQPSEFVKPSVTKIVLFVFLIILTSVFPNVPIFGANVRTNYGLPFNFYGFGGGSPTEPTSSSYFYPVGLLLDILIWYLVSCTLISAIERFGRNKKTH